MELAAPVLRAKDPIVDGEFDVVFRAPSAFLDIDDMAEVWQLSVKAIALSFEAFWL